MMAPTVAVTRDTYVRLAQLKRPGETFNDVIRRLAGRPDLMRYAGSISDADGRQLRADRL
jgi:predicted CopG family antitoxin